MRGRLPALGALAFVVLMLSVGAASAAEPHRTLAPLQASPGALVVNFNVPVDPGGSDYVGRAASAAIADGWDLVIVMNTPGGILQNMQEIVSSIQNVESQGLHVYTWVPPSAMAASAGSYIALATDAIYMGNGSFIGPSTPYIVGGDPSEVQHVVNAMIAYITALAQKNGYNVTAAANMAANNTAYSAADAVSARLVTGFAETLPAFLAAVGLSGVPTANFAEPLTDQFLSFLSDPTVDGLFITVGMLALVLDLFHRTMFLTVVAVIMIALGFLGAQIIGASLVGILVLIIAAVLILIEVKAGHGFFAITGVVLGLAGTFLLVDGVGWSPQPFGAGQYLLMGVVAGLALVAFVYLAKIRRIMMRQPKLLDPKLVVNKTGRAATDLVPGKDGMANIGAEDFTAVADEPIPKGTLIRVKAYEDGKVRVERIPPAGTARSPSSEESTSAKPQG